MALPKKKLSFIAWSDNVQATSKRPPSMLTQLAISNRKRTLQKAATGHSLVRSQALTAARLITAFGLSCIYLFASAQFLSAQGAGDLEAVRAEVFQQIIENPDRTDLLREYVRLSLLLNDYESAAAQLEILSSLNPSDSSIGVDLAQAYLSLEAFEVSIAEATRVQSLDATPEELSRAQGVLTEASESLSRSQLEASIAVGGAVASEHTDESPFVAAQVLWNYDVGGANPTDWQTVLDFRLTEHPSHLAPHFFLRTGPRLPLAATTTSNIVQPYVQVYRDELSSQARSTEYFAGLAYFPHSSGGWSRYVDVALGRTGINSPQDRTTAVRLSFGLEGELTSSSTVSLQAGIQVFSLASRSQVSTGATISYVTVLESVSDALGVPMHLSVDVAYGAVDRSGFLVLRPNNNVRLASQLTLDITDESFVTLGYTHQVLTDQRADRLLTFEYGWRF